MMLYVVHRKRAGFSLIEIMVVVAIIAILTLVVTPHYTKIKAQSRLRACRRNVLALVSALEAMGIRHSWYDFANEHDMGWGDGSYSDIGDYYGRKVADETTVFPYLIENGYIASIPKCPTGCISSNGYSYQCHLAGYIGEGERSSSSSESYVKCSKIHYIGTAIVGTFVKWNLCNRVDNYSQNLCRYGWYVPKGATNRDDVY